MRIACIDDDKTFINLLKRLLVNSGYSLATFIDQKSFLDYITAARPDVLVIDLYMDGALNGIELIKSIREMHQFKNTPILAISRINEKKYIDKVIDLGATDYLSKPLDEITLINKLHLIYKKSIENDAYLATTPSRFKEATIEINAEIHSINENEITLSTANYITKSSLIHIPWQKLAEFNIDHDIMFNVKNVEREGDRFLLTCELNPDTRILFHNIKAKILKSKLDELIKQAQENYDTEHTK